MEESERKKDGSGSNKNQQQQRQDDHQQPEQECQQGGASAATAPGTAAKSASVSSSPSKKSSSAVGGIVGGGGGLASIAHQLTKKSSSSQSPKGKDDNSSPPHNLKVAAVSNGVVAHDDLPLGSEANSLSAVREAFDRRLNGRPDPRLLLGGQSFNSDASNQTTASSASLELLLNQRQMDPEILLSNLGFGSVQSMLPLLERVPERFLDHPSQAYGIDVSGQNDLENVGDEGLPGGNSGVPLQEGAGGSNGSSRNSTTEGGGNPGGAAANNGGAAGAASKRKPKTGIWTVARTLSMFGNLNRHQQHHQPGNASPVSGVPAGSVLNVPNQMYLASRGFYKQYEKATPEKEKLPESKSAAKPEKIKEEEEEEVKDTSGSAKGSDGPAASKRRMFQKTRSRQNWSLCDDESGDETGSGNRNGAGNSKKYSTTSSNNSEWVTKSMDDSLSREDSTGVDDSSLKFAYFSTTTESSNDSIDRNSDTEKAFEEIRQQYKDGHMGLLSKKERSSSEDLFLPRRSRSSKSRDADDEEEENGSGSRGSSGKGRVRFGDLSDDDNDDDDRNDINVDSLVSAVVGGGRDGIDGLRNEELDLLRASLDNFGESGAGGRYFISPANSRQATVEKAPSIVDHSYHPTNSSVVWSNDNDKDDDDDDDCFVGDSRSRNSNNNRKGDKNNNKAVEDFVSKENSSSNFQTPQLVRTQNSCDDQTQSGHSNVRIVVSNSTEKFVLRNSDGSTINNPNSDSIVVEDEISSSICRSSRLGVARDLHRASSDSGSSSSGTAVGSCSVLTATDDLDLLRLSESENSITDRDSISRMNSPSGFLQPVQGHGYVLNSSSSSSRREVEMVSRSVQTSSEDLVLAGEGDRTLEASRNLGVSASSSRNKSPSLLQPERSNSNNNNNSGCQLSSIPAGINPVQLIKRLHHSQDELPRMNSLQSDSSGFGDGEPGLDSQSGSVGEGGGNDSVNKVSTLGSSSESSGTIASSVTTTIINTGRRGKGDTATQTSIDAEAQSDVSLSQAEEADDHNSSKPRYISHCVILHHAPKNSKEESTTAADSSNNNDNENNVIHNKSNSFLPASQHEQYSPSSPLPNDSPLHDYYYYQHQFCDNDEEDEFLRHHQSSNGRNRRTPRSGEALSSFNNQNEAGPRSFPNMDPAPRGYVPSIPFQDYPHHLQPYHHRHRNHRQLHPPHHHHYHQRDPLDLDDSDSRSPHSNHPLRHQHHHPHNRHNHHHRHKNLSDFDDDDDIYDDDLDLAYNRDPQRHHHRGEGRSRNQTPLSEELAVASSYSRTNSATTAAAALKGRFSSPAIVTSGKQYYKSSTSTPILGAAEKVGNDGDDNNRSRFSDRVVSSMNVTINADGTHKFSTTTTSSTPRLHNISIENNDNNISSTSTSEQYPALAGNVSGVRTEDSNNNNQNATNATTYSKPPVFPAKRKTYRQKSCDILDEDDGDENNPEQENRFFKFMVDDGNDILPAQFDDDYADVERSMSEAADANIRPQYLEPSLLSSPRPGYYNYSNTNTSSKSPVMPMTFSPHEFGVGDKNRLLSYPRSASYHYPSPTLPLNRTWDDLEGGYSSIADSSSEFSIRSMPTGGRKSNGVLDSQTLARLVNRPSSSIKASKRRSNTYQPRRNFREWHVLSRRKRLMEEDHLLQHSIHKYKAEMSLMQSAFTTDCGKAFADMTDEEREEVQEVESLWGEVKGQIAEMEDLVNSRVQSVHSGNDFHSLLSSLGIVDKTIELLKEQIYQQQVSNRRGEDGGESGDDLIDDFNDDYFDDAGSSRDSILSSARSLMEGSAPPWQRRGGGVGGGGNSWRMMGNIQRKRPSSSASTSNLPSDIDLSLEEMKSSLLREMKNEIRVSTQRLEQSLTKKELEIQELKKQLESSKISIAAASPSLSTPPIAALPSSSSSTRAGGGRRREASKTTPSSTKVQRRSQAWIARSRSRVVGDRVVRETDI